MAEDVVPDIDAIAAWAGIAVPAECRVGVAANLAILARHMATVREAAADAPPDPAEWLQP